MSMDPKLVDQLLGDYKKPDQIVGENGLLKQLTKALLERAMNAELNEHLGYGRHDPAGYNSGNSRNGTTKKKLKGDFGEMDLETPRDRNGTFRAKDGREASDAVHGLRRQDPVDVRPRHVDARDSGALAGSLRG